MQGSDDHRRLADTRRAKDRNRKWRIDADAVDQLADLILPAKAVSWTRESRKRTPADWNRTRTRPARGSEAAQEAGELAVRRTVCEGKDPLLARVLLPEGRELGIQAEPEVPVFGILEHSPRPLA